MKFIIFLSIILSSVSSFAKNESWFDQSHEVLIPRKIDKKLLGFQEFPIFWWNFLIYEFPKDQSISWEVFRESCERALHTDQSLVAKSPCEKLTGSMRKILSEWSRDFVLRHPQPEESTLIQLFNSGLAKATLPIEPSVMSLLREDPFNSFEEYRKKILDGIGPQFENKQGLFFDSKTNRVLVPIQMLSLPSRTSNMNELYQAATEICTKTNCKFLGGVGPHFSTWENESQIHRDVENVARAGWIVLAVFALFFVFSKRWKLLFLFPPLLLATAFAAVLTYLIYGKIHGLTLSFGPSIVGMALDYGLHGAFEGKKEKNIWWTNLFGLLTTIVIFAVLLLSELPILNQLAVFSILGLTISFSLFYLMKVVSPRFYHVSAFVMTSKRNFVVSAFATALLGIGLITPFFLHPDLSLKQINFESALTTELRTWAYSSGTSVSPLIDISARNKNDILIESSEKSEWAENHKIKLMTPANYLPSLERQKVNLDSWQNFLCSKKFMSNDFKTFFQPFWSRVGCQTVQLQGLSADETIPRYLQDLYSNKTWMTLWSPRNAQETEMIQSRYPSSESFVQVLSTFASTLESELRWIVPLALLLAFVFLYFHSRSLKNSLFSLIPFFCGIGFFYLATKLFNLNLSFISVIGLIMVFGFSIDYGIFMMNLITSNHYQEGHGVHTSITLASMSTIFGFAPLMFAMHPALKHLGQSLFFGACGAYLGAVWAIPMIYYYVSSGGKK